ncbi:hypothetical protein CF327_g889 [Tilletia walkeri]|nr:hypothetical protein CF327_g889 [Tilletia walkeri]
MAGRRSDNNTAGPSSRNTRDHIPITAYGAPAAIIDSNAIGFNGIRSLATRTTAASSTAAGAGASAGASAPAGGVPARPVEDLISLNLSQEEENKLPRSERNLLRNYRKANNLLNPPPTSRKAAADAAAAQAQASAAAAAALRPSTRVPDLRRGTPRSTITPSDTLADLDSAAAAGIGLSDLVPNPNGSGAQRRDLFTSATSLRSGTHTNVLNASMASASVSSSRSAGTSASRHHIRGNGGGGGGVLGLSHTAQEDLDQDQDGRRIFAVAMRPPPTSSHNSASVSAEGRRRRAEAAEEGIVIPDSSSSLGTLSPPPRGGGGRRGMPALRNARGSGTDEDSESAAEGQKHTRTLQRAGATDNSSVHSNTGLDTPRASRMIQKGKARQVDEGQQMDEEEEEENGGRGPSARSAGGRTPRRTRRAIDRAVSPFSATYNRAAAQVKSGLSPVQYVLLFLFCILVSLLAHIVMRIHDPVALLGQMGVPVERWLLLPSSSARGESISSSPIPQAAGTTAEFSLPPDLVRRPALDKVGQDLNSKVDKLAKKQAADKKSVGSDVSELWRKYESTRDDLELVINQLHAVSGRVDVIDRDGKEVARVVKKGSVGSGAPLMEGKKPNDVVTHADLRLYHADGTGREDLANMMAGARVIPHLTTWDSWWGGQYGVKPSRRGGFWKSRFASSKEYAHAASDPNMHNPTWALSRGSNQAGNCWQFPASIEATLGISLVRPAHIDAFSIEHIPRELVPDRKSAPLEVEMWGIVDVDDVDALESWRVRMEHEREASRNEAEGASANSKNTEWEAWVAEGGDQPQPTPPSAEYVLMGVLRYVLPEEEEGEGKKTDLQMVQVRPSVRKLRVKVGRVQLRFRGNHGAENTCVYRVRVHPELGGEA